MLGCNGEESFAGMFDDPSWSLPDSLDDDGFLAFLTSEPTCFGPPSTNPSAGFCLEPVALSLGGDHLWSGSSSSRASSPKPPAAYCSGPRLVTPQVCSGPSSRAHCKRTSTLASLPPLTPAATMVSTFFSFCDPPATQFSSLKEQQHQQQQQWSSSPLSTPASPAPGTPDNTVNAAAVSPSLSSDSDGSLPAPSGSDVSDQQAEDNKMDISDDSEEDDEESEERGSNMFGANKRKAPEVDWRAITDPAERRRQRRLAKNRVTAARSRDRKKVQWVELEERLQVCEHPSATEGNKAVRSLFCRVPAGYEVPST